MNIDNRKRIGNYGETLARRAYEQAGYTICAQQYRCAYGEIDLIAYKERTFVFIEVRTKTSDTYGDGAQSITERKKNTIKRVSRHYLFRQAVYAEQYTFQYDVISIYIDKKTKQAWLTRYEHAFE